VAGGSITGPIARIFSAMSRGMKVMASPARRESLAQNRAAAKSVPPSQFPEGETVDIASFHALRPVCDATIKTLDS
jgi:hypothetical protein